MQSFAMLNIYLVKIKFIKVTRGVLYLGCGKERLKIKFIFLLGGGVIDIKKLVVYFFLLILSIIIFAYCSVGSRNSMTGIYLKSINGSNIIVSEENGPIIMGNKTGKENVFHSLKSGDKIKIIYNLINETYPANTEIYRCRLIKKGSIYDISKDTLYKLQEMGFDFELTN